MTARFTLAPPIIALGITLTSCGSHSGSTDTTGGVTKSACSADVAPIAESPEFTPWELQRGGDFPDYEQQRIEPLGGSASFPATLGGQRAVGRSASERTVYYATSAEVGDLVTSVVPAGGISLTDLADVPATTDLTQGLAETIGRDRFTTVALGDLEGVLVWADPYEDGSRPHVLSWVQDGVERQLVADRSAEDVVRLGRELVCGGPLPG